MTLQTKSRPTLALALMLLTTAQAQTTPTAPGNTTASVRVAATHTPRGSAAVVVGLSPIIVRGKDGAVNVQYPRSLPKPPTTTETKPTTTSLIVTQKQVLRVIHRNQPTTNLNPLELQLSCEDKFVKIQAGQMIDLLEK